MSDQILKSERAMGEEGNIFLLLNSHVEMFPV